MVLNYFWNTHESPINVAMRSRQYDEVDALVRDGADIATPDNTGHTAIDYAVFYDQVNELPRLFGKSDIKNFSPKNSIALAEAFSKEITLKSFINIFSIEQLQDPTSDHYTILKNWLDDNNDKTVGPLQSRLIHFLAKCAHPEIIRVALELYPDWVSLRDSEGNTPLHYASQNINEKAFVDLVQKDESIVAMNIHGETPLGLLIYRLQQLDPLTWNWRDVIIFLADWLPTFISGLNAIGVPSSFSQPITNILNLGLNWFSDFAWGGICADNLSSPTRFLLILAIFGSTWIPIVNTSLKAYSTYCFVSRAYRALKTAWNYLHCRPLKALMYATVHVSNATNLFYKYWVDPGASSSSNSGSSSSKEGNCSGYKPLSDLTISPIERLEQVDRPDCERGALDIYGVSDVSFVNKSLYRKYALEISVDKICQEIYKSTQNQCTSDQWTHFNALQKKFIQASITLGLAK